MARQARVVVVGSANMDLAVRAERIAAPGETVLGGAFRAMPGGKGANQAVAAARLGATVHFVGRVGADAFGEELAREMEAAGVFTSRLSKDTEAPSGVALIGVDERTGQNAIMVAPGANGRLSLKDIDAAREEIAAADWLAVQLEIPLETVVYAIQVAKEVGTRVLLNPAPANPNAPLSNDLLRSVDLLTPNEHEAAALLGVTLSGGEDMAEMAQRLLAKGVPAVLITLGAEGCLLATAAGTQAFVAPKAEAVDTTAAGDCVSGAMGEGGSLEEAICFAIRAASLSVTRAGAQPSLPYRAELNSATAMQIEGRRGLEA